MTNSRAERETALGKYIYHRRDELGLTLDTLAKLMQSSKTFIWGLEHGRHAPSIITGKRLAVALCTTLENIATLVLQDEAHYERSNAAAKRIRTRKDN